MLCMDPQIRPTAAEVLQHEWITNIPKESEKEDSKVTAEAFKNLSNFRVILFI